VPRSRRTAALLAVAAATLAAAVPAVAGPSGTNAATGAATPTYREYDLAFKGGEPTIGYDAKRNAIFYAGGNLTTLRLTFAPNGKMTRQVVSPSLSPDTLDTILVTDQRTGRTFVSYLALACSIMAYTDDAGETWNQSTGCGAGSAVDHQSVGVGPIHAPVPATAYDGSVYYCAQDSFNGQCSVSLDGGVTFGPGVPVANTPANNPGDPFGGACSALHGHLRVAPDGTAYLPLKGCGGTPTLNNLTNSEFFGGRPSLSVSENNGVTWQIRMGPAGSHNPDESDPSVAIGPKGTLYFGWQDGTNPSDFVGGTQSSARIATSKDGGKTWSTPVDVSSRLGLHNIQFPEVIAGDDDRAAFAFVATPGVGNDQDDSFKGDWRLYVATTYDAGKTWTTIDATPKNLINRGCVHMLGLAPGTQRTDSCSFRNMLDFNDITVDHEGRVYVAYTDACGADCSAKDGTNADQKELFVLRQACGKGLVAAYDKLLTSPTCAKTQAITVPPTGTGSGSGSGSGRGGNGGTGSGGLPATGLPAGLAVVALLTTAGATLIRRRVRAA
jgi:hypothetical protein